MTMKSGMHKMPGGKMMKDEEMKPMMGEYKTPGWAKKQDPPAKKKVTKRKAR